MRIAIYARCSTDESRQDVGNQIEVCKKYCVSQGWAFDVFPEYESAFSGKK